MKNDYWQEEEDVLMKIILTQDSNTKEWIRAYNVMLPKLKYMGISILRKHYNVPDDNNADDIVMDAITKLILNGEYNPLKPKLYSYCGVIMRRYFTDELVRKVEWGNNQIYDKLNYIDDDESFNQYEDINDEELNAELRQEQLDVIINKLQGALDNCYGKIKKNKKKTIRNQNDMSATNREIEFLKACIKYFNSYFLLTKVSPISISEYLYNNCGYVPVNTHTYYMKKYFNVGSNIKRNTKIVKDNILTKNNLTYIQDDFTPEENNYRKNIKRGLNSDYNYF